MPLIFGDIYFPENFNTEFALLKDKLESGGEITAEENTAIGKIN